MRATTTVLLLVGLCAAALGDVDSNQLDAEDIARSLPSPGSSSLLEDVVSLWSECGVDDACLKVKLVAALDRVARGLPGDVTLTPGVSLVREKGGEDPVTTPMTERQLEAVLPRSLEDKEKALDGMIYDRVSGFFRSRALQLRLSALEDVQRSFTDEGRKKGGLGGGGGGGKKGGYGLLLLPMMMFGSLIPLAFGALFLLAGKALLVSKIALLLAAILGLKKLFNQDSHGHESTVVVSGHEHHGRSFLEHPTSHLDPQLLAYRAYLPAGESVPVS